ncbi:MAG: ribosomal-processing cysteine protease Prp [Clostridia bacterium]|nr:ribosomal-processing cysteine protease Prp [Clostridia bacterium]
MIRFTLHSTGGQITGFSCSGHAGYAEKGSDIVCAAVSVLTTTCVNALESVAGEKPHVIAKDGQMILKLPKESGHDAQVILRSLWQGMRDLAEEYPPYLVLNES